jgi:hypothetical protein
LNRQRGFPPDIRGVSPARDRRRFSDHNSHRPDAILGNPLSRTSACPCTPRSADGERPVPDSLDAVRRVPRFRSCPTSAASADASVSAGGGSLTGSDCRAARASPRSIPRRASPAVRRSPPSQTSSHGTPRRRQPVMTIWVGWSASTGRRTRRGRAGRGRTNAVVFDSSRPPPNDDVACLCNRRRHVETTEPRQQRRDVVERSRDFIA